MRVSFEEVPQVINRPESARFDGESRAQHPRVVALR